MLSVFLDIIRHYLVNLLSYLRLNESFMSIKIMPPGSKKELFVFAPYKIIDVQYRSTERPRPRSGHRIVCDDVNIYCFGGYNPDPPDQESSETSPDNPTWTIDKPLFKELWSYSIANRTWKQHKVLENMPEELASNAMCMCGKCVMIFGGTGQPFGDKCSNDVIAWPVSNGDARFKVLDVQGTRPPKQYGQSILCYDNKLLTVGGTNGYSYNCDVYSLDLKTMTWEALFLGTGQDNEPLGRYRHEVARIGNKLYILGGGTGTWAFELTDIPIFDLETRTWSVVNTKVEGFAPVGRKCHSAVQVNTPNGVEVFVAGGSDAEEIFDDVWKLDVKNLKWILMEQTFLPYPLFFHAATATSYGCMYIFGGKDVEGRNNKLSKVWLCIPKLSEIAFEAMLHYNPDLGKRNSKDLLNYGIPIHLVKRLVPN